MGCSGARSGEQARTRVPRLESGPPRKSTLTLGSSCDTPSTLDAPSNHQADHRLFALQVIGFILSNEKHRIIDKGIKLYNTRMCLTDHHGSGNSSFDAKKLDSFSWSPPLLYGAVEIT